MTVRLSRSPARFRRVAMLAIAVTLVPLPLLAADRATPPAAHSIKASIAKHAAHDVLVSTPARTDRKATATRAQASNPNPQSGGFFRSPAGIACLAVIGAGTAYAIYSANHDRIHSLVRQGQ